MRGAGERRKLLSDFMRKLELEGSDFVDVLKSINIKDVIYMVAKSFEEIPSSTIVKSWRKALSGEKNADDNPISNEGIMYKNLRRMKM